VTYKNINMPVANGVQEHGKLCHTKAKWRPWNGSSPKIHVEYQNNDTLRHLYVSGWCTDGSHTPEAYLSFDMLVVGPYLWRTKSAHTINISYGVI
jgi:hypothetical protein